MSLFISLYVTSKYNNGTTLPTTLVKWSLKWCFGVLKNTFYPWKSLKRFFYYLYIGVLCRQSIWNKVALQFSFGNILHIFLVFFFINNPMNTNILCKNWSLYRKIWFSSFFSCYLVARCWNRLTNLWWFSKCN